MEGGKGKGQWVEDKRLKKVEDKRRKGEMKGVVG